MKNGLFFENNELIYYKDDAPKHAGVVKIDDAIYYIGSQGRAVKGRHVVHSAMSNGILKHGTYTFGDDYKLIADSYIAPEKRKSHVKKKKKRSNSRSTERLMFFFKKYQKLAWALCGIALCIVVVSVYEAKYARSSRPVSEFSPASDVGVQKPLVMLPSFEEEVQLCSEPVQLVYKQELTMVDIVSSGEPYRPLIFRYDLHGKSGVLLVSENSDFSHAREYPLSAETTTLTIDNLKTGTEYFYKAIVEGAEYPGSFRTAATTRFVTIPGVKNTRDIGGYTTLDGKTVKQGLIIRGTEMDGRENPAFAMPKRAQKEVQDTFGFVYDLDLRQANLVGSAYQSPLGADVGYYAYSSPQYGQIFNVAWQPNLKLIFSALADPNKYPMYLHCVYGQDRTGTIVFLLQGILNMSLDDMLYEYRLSAFLSPYLASGDLLDSVVLGLESYKGNTTQEQIVDFLTSSIGITQEQIDSIRSIFLED